MNDNALHSRSTPLDLELIEVVDRRNRPLMALPREDVHRQRLLHRSVLILVFDRHNRLYIQKRGLMKTLYPGRWDVSAGGHVLAGESCLDAALREVQEELGVTPERLVLRQEIPAAPETAYEFVSLFSAGSVTAEIFPNEKEVEDGYFVEPGELDYMIREFPELLTPALLFFARQNLLFPVKM
ncbi:MAG: NUDIX hydrolase [Desulfovibrionales bacterium]